MCEHPKNSPLNDPLPETHIQQDRQMQEPLEELHIVGALCKRSVQPTLDLAPESFATCQGSAASAQGILCRQVKAERAYFQL